MATYERTGWRLEMTVAERIGCRRDPAAAGWRRADRVGAWLEMPCYINLTVQHRKCSEETVVAESKLSNEEKVALQAFETTRGIECDNVTLLVDAWILLDCQGWSSSYASYSSSLLLLSSVNKGN